MFIRPFYRIRYIGKENIPKSGGLLICSNHISFFDPIAIGLGVRRKIYFMAKSEFFTNYGFLVRSFFKSCGVIPVNRGKSDMNAIDTAKKYIGSGRQIGIFPQGGISKNRRAFLPKAGAALISVRTEAPIIPVSIFSLDKIHPFCKITVRFGKPVYPPKDNSLKSARCLTVQIREKIISQLEEEHKW